MKDYWSKLKLNECWSNKQRFNIIMNEIFKDNETEVIDNPVEDEITEGTVNILVTDEDNKPIKDADVSIYDKGEPYEATTDKNGECSITNIPFGDYTIEAVAEGYDFTVEQITINQETQNKTLILKEDVDDTI